MFTFPAKRQKRLPFLRQSASITYNLFLYMAVATYLTSISRKVPPSEPPAAVTGISLLSAYLFAMMYASAPEKFYIQAITRLLTCPVHAGITVAEKQRGFSPHFR